MVRVAIENSNAKHVHFRVGVNPVCDDDDPIMPAGHVETIAVLPGEKIAFAHAQGTDVKVSVSDIL